MHIEAFLLCNAATESGGKLNILGAFANIQAKEMPFVLPACAVVARIRFEQIEQGRHNTKLQMIDADGARVGPKLKGAIDVQFPENTDTAVTNLILNIQRLKFEKFGKYRIDLAIDGQIASTLPLLIAEQQSQPPQSSPQPPAGPGEYQ